MRLTRRLTASGVNVPARSEAKTKAESARGQWNEAGKEFNLSLTCVRATTSARRDTVNARATRRFVAYYRVSTDRQGRSGLGLEAQQKAVMDFLNGGAWELKRIPIILKHSLHA